MEMSPIRFSFGFVLPSRQLAAAPVGHRDGNRRGCELLIISDAFAGSQSIAAQIVANI